jgi:autotransporter passenger strand-loop-strand repeat protein/probable HAF family extracellular repeat protein
MQIIPRYDDGTVDNSGHAAEIKAAINYVCNLYDGLFTNNVTINIEISWGTTPPGAAAENKYPLYSADYATIKNYLGATLPDQDPLPLAGGNNQDYELTSAQVKALGIPLQVLGIPPQLGGVPTPTVTAYPSIDDYVTFSSDSSVLSWDFGPGGNFIAAAEHEISEGMGRLSKIANFNLFNTVMDLFRYTTDNGSVVRDTLPGLPLSNATAFFSLDNGATSLGTWNNDPDLGDTIEQVLSGGNATPHYDLGDWVPGGGPAPDGDDAYGDGHLLTLSDLDLMRAIGWNTYYSPNQIPSGVFGWVPAGPAPTGQPYSNLTVFDGGNLIVGSGGESDADVLLGGLMQIEGGGSASSTSVGLGGLQVVDGETLDATVDSGGRQVVQADATARFTTVLAGGEQDVIGFHGGFGGFGTVRGSAIGTILSGGTQNVGIGVTTGTVVENGGGQHVFSGGIAIDTTLSGGIFYSTPTGGGFAPSEQDIGSGGVASGTIVDRVGFELVSGQAFATTVLAGGFVDVASGGIASDTIVNGGVQEVDSGGEAAGTVIEMDGVEDVFAGGLAVFTDVQSGGNQSVWSGGAAYGTILNPGGTQSVHSGGMVSGTEFQGGTQVIESGAVVSGEHVAAGLQHVLSGGTADATTIGAGRLELAIGGSAGDASITFSGRGGALQIDDTSMPANVIDGFAPGDVIDLAAVPFSPTGQGQLLSASTQDDLKIVENGSTYDLTLGTSVDYTGLSPHLRPDGGNGTEVIVAHVISVAAGQTVSGVSLAPDYVLEDHGTAIGTVVNGGEQDIYLGGIASGTVINSGAEYVYSGGTASSTTVGSGGAELVFSGGIAGGTVVNNGGTEYVHAGGEADGATINGGLLEVATGASLGAPITFAGPSGTLRFDAATPPPVEIDGFAPGDTIDLAGVPYGPGSADLESDVLKVTVNGQEYDFNAPGAPSGQLRVLPDGQGGTEIRFPLMVTAALAHDTGASSTDGITADDTITGAGDPNTVVGILVVGGIILPFIGFFPTTEFTASVAADAFGNWTYTPAGLGDGEYVVGVGERDALGNTVTTSLTFFLDTSAPVLTPVANQIYAATGAAGAVATFGATATDTDPTSGQPITVPVLFSEGMAPVLSGQTFSVGTHTITASATDTAGNTGSETFTITVVDPTPPKILSVVATPGDYGAGQTITLTLDMSKVVTVAGTPTLTLNDGGSANYVSGSGTNALTFSYTVGTIGSGQNTPALAVTAVNGVVTDLLGQALGSAGLPETFTGVQVDTTAPGLIVGPHSTFAFTSFDDPAGMGGGSFSGTTFFAINNAGVVVGQVNGTANDGGFVYSAGTYTPLNDPLAVGGTFVADNNNLGQIVGYYSDAAGVSHGFYFDGSSYTPLDFPFAVATFAQGINDVGQITGSYTDGSNVTHGFLYSHGVYFRLDDPLAVGFSQAEGINNAGQITGSYTDANGTTHGYLYSNGTFTTLDDPLESPSTGVDFGSFTYGINNLGQMVGGYVDSNRVTHGFVYENGTYTDLNYPGATTLGTVGFDINDVGQIAGQYATGGALFHGFLAAINSTAAGVYGPGQTVSLTLDFSEPVNVSGTPTLTLNNGAVANYASGSGSNALTFTYVVGATGSGRSTPALAATAINGSITDLAGNALSSLGLPEVFGGVVIDTTAPGLIIGPHFTFAFTSYDDPNGTGATNFSAVNNFGVAVGDVSGGTVNGGFVYNAGTYTPVHDPSAPGVTSVSDDNNLGQIVGIYTDASGADHGFFDNGGNFTQLDFPSAVSTDSIGLNDLGQVAGYYTDSSNIIHGFLYSNGSYFSFDAPSAAGQTFAQGINNAGQIAGFYFDAAGTAHGFIDTNGTFTVIDVPGATSTYTYDINNLGQIAGSYADSSGLLHAFLYQSGVFRTIDEPAAIGGTNGFPGGTDGFDINDVGMIAGDYATANNAIHGYLASIVSSAAGLYGPGQTVSLTLDFNEPVIVSGTPTLALNDGGIAHYASGTGTSALTFTYVVGPTGSGQSTPALAATAINGSITDLAGNALSSLGLPEVFGGVVIDTTAPTVVSIAASPTSGDKNTSDTITLTVTLSKSVTVTGTPVLALNDGGTAAYQGGSSSNVLTFTYKVANAQNTPALAVTGNNLNGTTVAIKDSLGNEADLSGTDVTFAGLAVGATVKSITANPATGDLGPHQTITFTVTMSEAVKVIGSPRLLLNDGGIATYRSGSGSNVLTFAYTVGGIGSGQNMPALAVTSYDANGGTIYDSNVRADTADLSGVTAFTGGPQIDTTSPTVTSVTANPVNGDLNAGKTVTLTVTFSEAVTVAGGTPHLNLSDGGKATYSGGSGTSTLTFTYVVGAGENTPDLAVNELALNGATIRDAAENNAVLSGAAGNPAGSLQIDTRAPTISSVATSGTGITNGNGDLAAGSTVRLTANFSENVSVAGSPILKLNDGGTATYTSGSGMSALTFAYVVAAGENTSDLTVTGLVLNNGATIADGAGNAAVLSGAVRNPAGTLKIDTTAPTVRRVDTTPGSGEVTTGHIVTIGLAMSEDVTVTGAPVLLLNDGGTASYDSARSSTAAAVFDYTVKSGEVTTDLKVSGMAFAAGASIVDLAGNPANLAGAAADLGLRINTTARGSSGPSGGSYSIGGSDALELVGASTANVTFASGGSGTLKLDDSAAFTGLISGFGGADHIDLADITFGAGTALGYTPNSHNTGGTLTANDGSHIASIGLLGQYMSSQFVKSSDGHGGTLVSDPPPGSAGQPILSQPHA